MIPDTSAQDRPLSAAAARPVWRRWLWPAVGAALVLALLAWVVAGWGAGARSYDGARIRIAEVKRGDLVRDISADGKVITANSPTLYAIAGGTVTLKVVAGDAVKKGQELAVIDSPELRSKLVQEESTLASMEAEASRAQLDARIARLNARKALDQARIEHTAAGRDLSATSAPTPAARSPTTNWPAPATSWRRPGSACRPRAAMPACRTRARPWTRATSACSPTASRRWWPSCSARWLR